MRTKPSGVYIKTSNGKEYFVEVAEVWSKYGFHMMKQEFRFVCYILSSTLEHISEDFKIGLSELITKIDEKHAKGLL